MDVSPDGERFCVSDAANRVLVADLKQIRRTFVTGRTRHWRLTHWSIRHWSIRHIGGFVTGTWAPSRHVSHFDQLIAFSPDGFAIATGGFRSVAIVGNGLTQRLFNDNQTTLSESRNRRSHFSRRAWPLNETRYQRCHRQCDLGACRNENVWIWEETELLGVSPSAASSDRTTRFSAFGAGVTNRN